MKTVKNTLALNSVLIADVTTEKPAMSRALPEQHRLICERTGVNPKDVEAPKTKLLKCAEVTEAFAIINGMTPFLRAGREGLTGVVLTESMASGGGATYIKASDIPAIQQEFDARQARLATLLKTIRENFTSLIEARLATLHSLAAEIIVPTVDEFMGRFVFEMTLRSLPASIDESIIGQATEETAARIRASNAKVQDEFRQAHAQPVASCIAELANTIDQLTKGKRLRQERLDKLASAAASMREQNWLGLPDLSALATKLEGLAINRDALPDKAAREGHATKVATVKGEAESLLSAFGI